MLTQWEITIDNIYTDGTLVNTTNYVFTMSLNNKEISKNLRSILVYLAIILLLFYLYDLAWYYPENT